MTELPKCSRGTPLCFVRHDTPDQVITELLEAAERECTVLESMLTCRASCEPELGVHQASCGLASIRRLRAAIEKVSGAEPKVGGRREEGR